MKRNGSQKDRNSRGSQKTPPRPADEVVRLEGRDVRSFDPAALEADLRALWRSAASGKPDGGRSVYRAAMSNLVVPVDPECNRRVAPALADLTRRHPARLFLVEIEGGPGSPRRGAETAERTAGASEPTAEVTPELAAEVVGLCHIRPGGGFICSEQILLRGGRAAGPLVPSAIRALLLSDLPTVLLDLRLGSIPPWLEELIEGADLVLIDSGLAETADLQRVWLRQIERDPTGRVRDLAWARLTPWRAILAEAFDQVHQTEALAHIQEIKIEYGGGAPVPTCALLLAGWLASRLGWKPAGRTAHALKLRSGGRDVRVRFEGDPRGGGRAIERVRLRSGSPAPLDLEVRHSGRNPYATVEVHAPAPFFEEVPFVHRDFAVCVAEEIHRHAANPLLREAAAIAHEMSVAWDGT